jgi:hypothetical protein
VVLLAIARLIPSGSSVVHGDPSEYITEVILVSDLEAVEVFPCFLDAVRGPMSLAELDELAWEAIKLKAGPADVEVDCV